MSYRMQHTPGPRGWATATADTTLFLGLVLTAPLAVAFYWGATGSWADLLAVLLVSMFPVPFLGFVVWAWVTLARGIRHGWEWEDGGFAVPGPDPRPPDGDEDGDA